MAISLTETREKGVQNKSFFRGSVLNRKHFEVLYKVYLQLIGCLCYGISAYVRITIG